jgi:hypothetical protein
LSRTSISNVQNQTFIVDPGSWKGFLGVLGGLAVKKPTLSSPE